MPEPVVVSYIEKMFEEEGELYLKFYLKDDRFPLIWRDISLEEYNKVLSILNGEYLG